MQSTVTRREWWWVLIVSHAVFIFSSLPFLAGYAAQTAGRDFAGGYHSRSDYAVYISMMHYGRQGHWDYHLRFTSEAHNGIYTRLFYVAAGNISRWTNLDPIHLFHIARWVFGILACLGLYMLTAQIFVEPGWRRFTFLLAITGAGAGWLQAILLPGARPVDMLFADGYVFFGMVTFPHYSATTAAILLSISSFNIYLQQNKIKYLFGIVLLGVFTQFINPIAFALADLALAGTLIGYMLYKKRFLFGPLTGLLTIGLTQLPQFFLNTRQLGFDPFWSQFTAQNAVPSPPLTDLLWAYGLLWIILPTGIFAILGKRNWPAMGLLAWLAGALLLAYGPFPIQVRFLHAFIVPLSILGVFGIKEVVFPYLERKAPDWVNARKNLITFALLMFSMITSLKVSLGDAIFLYSHTDSRFYEPHALTSAIDWLGANSNPDDMILGTEQTSQWAAIRIGRPVFLGHLFETLDYQNKRTEAGGFYLNPPSAGWLMENNIRWVIYGPHEQDITPSFQPDNSLQLVYENEAVKIYEVTSP